MTRELLLHVSRYASRRTGGGVEQKKKTSVDENLVILLLSFSQQARLVVLRPLQFQSRTVKLRFQRRHANQLE